MKADWPTTTPLSGPSEQCLPYTIVRHPIYSEWFINPGLRRSIEPGELTGSSAGLGMNAALRADLAEAAAVVLDWPNQLGGSYDFTGRCWTFDELAPVLSDISGRTSPIGRSMRMRAS
jgi:NAD(P)H dehydrogenase (quinone)